MLQTVLTALEELRSPFALYETDIHQRVARQLEKAGLAYRHEARIAPGCRIDFLVGEVGVEIKKGKPDARALALQLNRYAQSQDVQSFVVITQRMVAVPKSVLGKPVRHIVLNQLWGVALP